MCVLGKNIGRQMLVKNMNWCDKVYVEDYFNWKIIELAMPNKIPGINSTNFITWYYPSIKIDPKIIIPNKYLNAPILLPLNFSHIIAKIRPPLLFQPQINEDSTPIKPNKQATFS